MDFWLRIEQAKQSCDVLDHKWYQRWNAGDLSKEELGFYAAEYRYAVLAVANASHNAAEAADSHHKLQDELKAHAVEEDAHVELWDQFAAHFGADIGRPPLAETVNCAKVWTGKSDDDLALHLAALYAIESTQPELSRTKAVGLSRHYGVAPGSTASVYFDIHSKLDIEHAAHARKQLNDLLETVADEDALVSRVEEVLQANWELLDGVQKYAAV